MQGETNEDHISQCPAPSSGFQIISKAESQISIPLHLRSFLHKHSRTVCPFSNRAGKTQQKAQASLK